MITQKTGNYISLEATKTIHSEQVAMKYMYNNVVFDIVHIYNEHDLHGAASKASDYRSRIILVHNQKLVGKALQCKAIMHCFKHISRDRIKALIDPWPKQEINLNEYITLSTKEGFEVIKKGDILRFEAQRAYCRIHFFNRPPIVIAHSMNTLVAKLNCVQFARVHVSHTINLTSVNKYCTKEGGTLHLCDGTVIPITCCKSELKLALSKLYNYQADL